MKITKVGTRGTLFVFDELQQEMGCTTNVYVIDAVSHIFICDTYLGPKPMQQIREFISSNMSSKPLVVFNSHSDWDHVWGNCAFAKEPIVAHEKCRLRLLEIGEQQLAKHGHRAAGTVSLVLPQITFSERLSFPDDGIEFFHTPGHTEGSASCYDTVDKVLFAGDNIEAPRPYLHSGNPARYLETLHKYQEIEPVTFVVGHGTANRTVLEQNIAYLKSLLSG